MASPGQQLMQLAFAGGVDQSQRDEIVDPTSAFLTLENVRQNKRGGVSKRNAFTALGLTRSDASSRSAGYKLVQDGTRLGVIDGSRMDVYAVDPDASAPVWMSAGRVPEAGVRTIPLPVVGDTAVTVVDVQECNGYLAVSYQITQTGGTTSCATSIIQIATGAVVYPPTAMAGTAAAACFLAATGNRYLVLMNADDGVPNTVSLLYIDTANPATIASGWQALATCATGFGGFFAAAMVGLTDRVAVAYNNDVGGTTRLTLATVTVPGGVESTVNLTTASANLVALDVCGSQSDTLWVAWTTSGTGKVVKIEGRNPTSLSTVKASQVTLVTASMPNSIDQIGLVESSTTGQGRAFLGDYTAAVTSIQDFTTTAGAAAASGSEIRFNGAWPISKPCRIGSRYYAVFQGPAASHRNAVLCDTTDTTTANLLLRPVANLCQMGLGVQSGLKRGKVSVAANGTTRYFGIALANSAVANSAAAVVMDFADTQRWKSASHAGSTFMTGGVTSYSDGRRVAEAGFLARPSTPTTSTTGTGITAATGWKYVCLYEEVDAAGNWCVSGISDPSASTGVVSNKTVQVFTHPLAITSRGGSSTYASTLRVAFYRTLDGGSPPYFRAGTVSVGTGAGSSTAAPVEFDDTMSDATLATQSLLYAPSLPSTPGESLDRRAPLGFSHLISYNGMLVGANGPNLFNSGQQVIGEGAWFSPLFQQPVAGQGDVTGLAAQDGTLYVFKRREIYAVSGDAPSDNGSSGGLGLPRRIAADVGCIDGRSIVGTAKGVFFQSERGIELLSRSQDVFWIGEQVRDALLSWGICTGATLDSTAGRVYFEMVATETANQVSGGGRTLVYNLTLGLWESADTRANSAGTLGTAAQSAAIVYTGSAWAYSWLGTDGRVYVEDSSTHLDPGSTWVTMKAETGWFKVNGLQGLQHANRVLFLGRKSTNHNLSLYVAYDYMAAYEDPRTWTRVEIDQVVTDLALEQLEHTLHDNAEGQSIRFKIIDATPSTGSVGSGNAATWIGLTLEVVPMAGAQRLPDECR